MKKSVLIFFLIFFCLSSLSIGTAFFCLKSPTQKIIDYAVTAQLFLQKSEDTNLQKSAAFYLVEQAEIYALKAQALNPYHISTDKMIERVEKRKIDLLHGTDTAFLPHKNLIP